MRITEKKITRTRAMAVKAEILAAAARGDTELDFADIESADSSAVAVVMAWVRRLQAKNLTPVLRHVPPKMTALMGLYGVAELLDGFIDKTAA